MLDRTVRLISPCYASKRWPLGYIVHAEGAFTDAAGFRDVLRRSIDLSASEHKAAGDRIAFREDLTYRRQADGFVLESRYRQHAAKGMVLARLGDLIRCGTFTTAQITDRLILEGMSVLEVATWLDRLHHEGLLADPLSGDVPGPTRNATCWAGPQGDEAGSRRQESSPTPA
jgi:hypothetical protein